MLSTSTFKMGPHYEELCRSADKSGFVALVSKTNPALPRNFYVLIWPTQPGVLPRYGNVLIVSAENNICAVAIADFDRLVFADWE